MNYLHKKIIDIAYKNKISHIGSAITAVDIIDDIYSKKQDDDIFILSSGHAGLALYVVLEKYFNLNAEELFKKHGLHPHRDLNDNIYCSTGSLGSGICVGVGLALANKNRTIHILISDGECFEGSVWESLNFISEHKLSNIKIYVNMNGFAAYKRVNIKDLSKKLVAFLPGINIIDTQNFGNIKHFSGLEAHYKILSKEEYNDLQ